MSPVTAAKNGRLYLRVLIENRRILEPLLEFPVDAEACSVDGLNDCSRAHQAPF